MAIRLFLHALRMIFGNLGQALKISLVPFAIAAAVFAVFIFTIKDTSFLETGGAMFLGFVLVFGGMLFVGAWVAVSWHRFVLLEEYVGIVPAISGRPIWPYIVKGFLLGLLVTLCVLLILFIAFIFMPALISPNMNGGTGVIAFYIINFCIGVFVTVLSLRWGIALVAIAVSEPLGSTPINFCSNT
jgi:hypothetical protein